MNIKKHKRTALQHVHDEPVAEILERSKENIRTAKELLADCRRTYERTQEIIARSDRLRERSRQLKSQQPLCTFSSS